MGGLHRGTHRTDDRADIPSSLHEIAVAQVAVQQPGRCQDLETGHQVEGPARDHEGEDALCQEGQHHGSAKHHDKCAPLRVAHIAMDDPEVPRLEASPGKHLHDGQDDCQAGEIEQ